MIPFRIVISCQRGTAHHLRCLLIPSLLAAAQEKRPCHYVLDIFCSCFIAVGSELRVGWGLRTEDFGFGHLMLFCAFTVIFYVIFSSRLIGKPRNTTAFSACQRKPTRILSDTNARHSTLALRGTWDSSSRRPLPCASTSTPTAALSPWAAHTSHTHRTLLASSPPPFLNTSPLPAPVVKCPGSLLIPSPSALALCSTLRLFLSPTLSPRYLYTTPPFSAVIKQLPVRGLFRFSRGLSPSEIEGPRRKDAHASSTWSAHSFRERPCDSKDSPQPFAPILQHRMGGGAGQSDGSQQAASSSLLLLPGALNRLARRRHHRQLRPRRKGLESLATSSRSCCKHIAKRR